MKKLGVVFIASVFCFHVQACTGFLLNDKGHYYFGKNYDWITGNGMVMINARDVKKFSTSAGKELMWTSQLGSITFNQYGKEFPTGGMNEKGLVIELMWLEGTKYPTADSRPALNVLQWIQYQLDNCTTIEDVIASDKTVRISESGTPLHYLIADSSGHTATIEFLDGKMVVHKIDEPSFPVLTNSAYSESVLQTGDVIKEKEAINFTDNSIQRFAQACSMISNYRSAGQNALNYAFSILQNVSQGQYTKWSIVYDLTERQIHFISNQNRNLRTVAFDDFDFHCSSSALATGINDEGSGNIAKSFKKLDFDNNKNLIETSVQQSSPIIRIPGPAVRETIDFFNKLSCLRKED